MTIGSRHGEGPDPRNAGFNDLADRDNAATDVEDTMANGTSGDAPETGGSGLDTGGHSDDEDHSGTLSSVLRERTKRA